MSYYMRYILTDARKLELPELAQGLVSLDSAYRVDVADHMATLHHGRVALGHLELNVPGDGLFDEEIGELAEFAQDVNGIDATPVPMALRGATGILAVQVLGGAADNPAMRSLLDPMWTWLFEHRSGLLQADGEGYYGPKGLLVAVD